MATVVHAYYETQFAFVKLVAGHGESTERPKVTSNTHLHQRLLTAFQ